MTNRPVIVVGAGIAGLATALRLAPLPVIVLTASALRENTSTAWAQGGIAAAVADDDAPALHQADTEAAGVGLVDPAIARAVTEAAPDCLRQLDEWGANFDRDANGDWSLGLEGAHGRRRVAHVGGDGSGVAILNALIGQARSAPSITIRENTPVHSLLTADGDVQGVHLDEGPLHGRAVVLATGGLSGLYAETTNPLGAVGRGVAMAARAGAAVADAEFVQFHPTAMAVGRDPMPLATEALRGEGATLVNADGEPLMADTPGGDLAARDVISRRIHAALNAGDSVYLDGREAIGEAFPHRYPAVHAACRAAGIDPAAEPIPIRPAAHYHMGGIAVDDRGRTGVPGLWACGEVACTGLHGANRLASNSLLEGLVFARWIAEDIAISDTREMHRPTDEITPVTPTAPRVAPWIRALMSRSVGVVRDNDGLARAMDALSVVAFDPGDPQADHALAALFVATAAQRRCESRGGHLRRDFPQSQSPIPPRMTLTLDDLQAEWPVVPQPAQAAGGQS
ncbi:L-aspartate oxidase [Spiribacter vilamensis]|uniref:L-aspartate oxidase n=1 Tax=Spiribacter vilamensis TaxID=531306 RepID=A0A4Q8D0M3_9GAMM|nr:L-aspartate oxidase [Spiribacter vilamensis]RZU98770.1 L-aspartate oxidase [Spiribacter vilamensis]